MAQIALSYSAAQIDAAIAKINSLVTTIEGSIVQLYDGSNAIYPRTKAEAVFFDNDTSKTLDTLLQGIDDEPKWNSSNLVKSGGILSLAKDSFSKGFTLVNGYLLNIDTTMNFLSSSNYCCIFFMVNGQSKITLDGFNGLYRYFNTADIFTGEDVTDNYISSNTAGIVPEGAVICVCNLKYSDYPEGFGNFRLIFEWDYAYAKDVAEEFKFAKLHDFFIRYSYIYSHEIIEGQPIVKPTTSSNWDCAYVPISSDSIKISMTGATSPAFMFFSSLEVFDSTTFLSRNSEGIIPAGAKTCIFNLKKENNPNGYGEMRIIFTKQYSNKKKIRLLSIGNSYSQDALAYVPYILQNMGIDTDIQIGIAMQSSSSLNWHVDNFEQNTAVYTYYYHNGGNAWINNRTKTIKQILDDKTWDIICLQQSSSGVFTWNTYQPYLNKLINLISDYVDYQVKFCWYAVQARPASANSGANWSDEIITSHYEAICTNAQKVMNETVCEFLIPVNTAIQNARTIASLKAMGGYASNALNTSGLGYLTPNDGVHLQEGLPCQIAAYTFVLKLLDIYGFDEYSINAESTRVTSEWASGKAIPGPHGDYIGSTDENCLIAQKCAIMAVKHPYEVTDMNYIVNPT